MAALEGGARVIDIKDPARGPLGAAPVPVRRAIARACAEREERTLVSAAAGELREHEGPETWESVEGIAFHKLGLSECAGTDWRASVTRWAASLGGRAPSSSLVLVAYADHGAAGSPPPREVLDHAAALGLEMLLLDTFDKSGGSLRDRMEDGELAELVRAGRAAGVGLALAGSLGLADLVELAGLGALVVGVRGAACRGSRRDGEVDARRVAELAAALNP